MPDLEDIELSIEIVSPNERSADSVFQAWLQRCPVYLALVKPMTVITSVEIRRG